jgi:hypothetical protein
MQPATSRSIYLSPGDRLQGRYEIEAEIGRGGYSVVYRALDRENGSAVAIKLLAPPPAEAAVARERMRREVEAVLGIAHPGIVAVHDFLEVEPWSFIVMELIDGLDLARQVHANGPLATEAAASVGNQVADALAAAHARGILHRDVKPQNILIDAEGRARLTDFGSARLAGHATVTRTGGLVGTIQYAAPELISGQRGDARSDIYALGLTLYYVLTGALPACLSPHLPPAAESLGHHPGELRDEIPEWLDAAVAHATRQHPGDRFATAREMAEALQPDSWSSSRSEVAERVACLLCGAADPIGLPICPRCGGTASPVSDTLIFAQRSIFTAAREEIRRRLADLLPDGAAAEDIALAAAGSRALVRIPAAAAPNVIEELKRREIPARAARASRAWVPLPFRFWALVSAVVAVGEIAGAVALPSLVAVSPLFAALLVLLAQRHLRRPLVEGNADAPRLPAAVEGKVIDTIAALSPGSARALLADIVYLAAGLYDALPATGDSEDLRSELDRLLAWACDAARDIAVLDENLERLEGQRDDLPEPPAGWMDSLSRTERVRDRLVQRLLELIARLGKLRSYSGAILASERELDQLAEHLEEHFAAHAEAVQQVEDLLAGRT